MPRYQVMLGRPTATGAIRSEVSDWITDACLAAQTDPRIAELYRVPIQRFPTSVARNTLVQAARQRGLGGADVLFMVDDDMRPPREFFRFALDFLLSHSGPAAIASPYVMGGDAVGSQGREDVCVFEWGQGSTGDQGAPFALVNVVREDAARRRGTERVANAGTGLIAYRMDCFDAFEKAHGHKVFFDYQYNAEHTVLTETEDCWCHRHLGMAGIPLYVSWEHWSEHRKSKWCTRPLPMTDEAVGEFFLRQARANLHAAGKQVPSPGSNGAAGDWLTQCTAVGRRPSLEPGAAPFTVLGAVSWALSVPGWMHEGELHWLAEQAARLHPGDAWVEVGTWKGRSAAAVALSLPAGARLCCVDTWRGSSDPRDPTHGAPSEVWHAWRAVWDALSVLRCNRVDIGSMRLASTSAASYFDPGELAAVFIDAGHDEGNVSADLAAWAPRVRPGGLLCGHDASEPGVSAALARMAPAWGAPVERGPGTLWYVRMPVPAPVPREEVMP
jgi:hypothetical protein